MNEIFEQLLTKPYVLKYFGFKEYVEFFEVYYCVTTNHPKGNVNLTLRPTHELMTQDIDYIVNYLYNQILSVHNNPTEFML